MACYQSKSSSNDTKRLIKPEFLTHSCAMQCRNFLNQFFLVSCFWFRRRHVCYHVVCDSSCCAPKSISRVRQLSYNGPTIFTGVITLHWRHSHVTIWTTKHVDSSTKDRGPSAITFSMHIWKKKNNKLETKNDNDDVRYVRYSTTFYTERLRPQFQPLTLLYTNVDRKCAPFLNLRLKNGTRFTYLV